MKLARHDNILAIKTASGSVVGFHALNLQVAHLDELAWEAIETSGKNLEKPRVSDAAAEVLNEIAEWNDEKDPAATDIVLKQEVRSLSINVAQVCNLKCTYCAAGGDGSYSNPVKTVHLPTIYDQIRAFLHDVPAGESFTITFFGGEPLIALEAIEAIARFARLQVAGRDIHLRFTTITNGTLVTAKAAELLASLDCHVTVSIDGPPDVNDISRPTRGGLGSTKRTLDGLAQLQAVRNRLGSLSAAAVFGRHHNGVLATYRFLRQFDFDSIKFDFAAELNDGETSRAYTEELLKTADEAFTHGGERELRKLSMFNTYFSALDQQRRILNHCGAGKDQLQTDARGKISVCQWFIGDAKEEVGAGAKLDREKLAQYASPLTELNGCGSCWARHLCGGGCMFVNRLKTGSKHSSDAEFCTRTRSTIAKAIEYYAQAR